MSNSKRWVYHHLLQSKKEVSEFPITPELRKSCKLAYQKTKKKQKKAKD